MASKTGRENAVIMYNKIRLLVVCSFVLICILLWLDEILDIPHLILGAPVTPVNWREALFETALVTAVCVLAILALFRIFSLFRRSDKELHWKSDFNFTLVQASPAFFVATGADGRTIMINESMQHALGYSADEVEGKDYMETFIPERERKDLLHVFERLSVFHEPTKNESHILTKTGRELLVEWHGRPMYKGDGAFDFLFGVGMDITDRERAEDALKMSEKRLSDIIEFLPDAAFVIDSEGKVISWNRAIVEMTGVKQEDILGKGNYEYAIPFYNTRRPILIDLINESDREIKERYSIVSREGGVLIAETEMPSIKGQRFTAWCKASPVYDDDGNIIGAIEVIRDITERKRTQERLKEYSERLEEMVDERTRQLRHAQEELVRKEKLAILGQLSGGVGHELRNPLGVISNAVYYLNAVLSDADDTAKEYLGIISSEVKNADKIVSDLLNLSRTRPANKEEVTITELIGKVFERQVAPENVEVAVAIPPDLPNVFIDAGQIGQALNNLVTNACQAMGEDGKLSIRAWEEERDVHISITDTGCGISKKDMDMLFEPLFTTKVGGIGLGLTVSKNLIEVNGGNIEVESAEGKGSKFTVILPAKAGVS